MTALINFNQLHKADIIVSTSRNSTESAAIRQATNSTISHALLVTGFNSVIEATAEGVKETTWVDAREHGKMTLAIALRHKRVFSSKDQDKIVEAARSFLNLPYDYLGAVGSGMFGSRTKTTLVKVTGCVISIPTCEIALNQIDENAKDENADKRFFCSELVARAFTMGSFPIVYGKATYTTPEAVHISTQLESVGYLVNTQPEPVETREEKYRRTGETTGYRHG